MQNLVCCCLSSSNIVSFFLLIVSKLTKLSSKNPLKVETLHKKHRTKLELYVALEMNEIRECESFRVRKRLYAIMKLQKKNL